MVITGKLDRILKDETSAIVSFSIPMFQAKYLDELTDETYKIEIKKVKSKKSLQQNNYAWAIMGAISNTLDLYPDSESVYLQIVKMAKIKTEYIMALDDIGVVNSLKKAFRVIKKVDERDYNGKQMAVYECCYGMSTFDKDDMIRFIDVLLDYATKNGINVDEYN